MDLRKLREQIDGIDEQIVALYEKRMDISRQVAEYKIETGKKVFDRQREQEKLARVKTLTHNEFNSHGVEELFEQIMSMSRKLQYQLLAEKTGMGRLPFIGVDELDTKKARVVFQGAEGAYSQAAMMTYFGDAVDSFHVDSFRDAMSAIDEGSADFAVLPIENSTAGIVSEIYDLLVEFENYIVGEQIIKIEHCLLGEPGAEVSEVKTVYSHPQSLMQCARYLADHDWQQISMQNNAFAAAKVAKEGDKTQAAIAGEHAGKIYGLKVLKKGIHRRYDCVLGGRFMRGSKLKGYSWFRTFGNIVYDFLFSAVVRDRIFDLGSGLNLYSVEMLKDPFYLKFPDNLTFNYCMILASHYYKHHIRFFPISWREEDQVSNVKMASQAISVLKMLGAYAWNHEFIRSELREQIREEYSADIIKENK